MAAAHVAVAVEMDDVPTRRHSAHSAIPEGEEEEKEQFVPRQFSSVPTLSQLVTSSPLELSKRAHVQLLYQDLKMTGVLNYSVAAQHNLHKEIAAFQNDGSRWTFLMQATYWGDEQLVRWLLLQGSDVSVRNADNQNSLDVALQLNKPGISEVLRKALERKLASAATGSPNSPTSVPIDISPGSHRRS